MSRRVGANPGLQARGNKKLRDLYEREGEEYFREYFDFTLLEYFGMSYDPQKVLERESWWKDCLDTRTHRCNDNWLAKW